MNIQDIKVIETEVEYETALERIDQLLDIDPEPESLEGRELQLLLVLVEKLKNAS